MLEIKNLTIKTADEKPLIMELNLVVNSEDKIAIIGEEGNGKSTLLKVINNKSEVEPYANISGEVHKHGLVIGYLEQSLDSDWNELPVHEYFVRNSPNSEINHEIYTRFNEISKTLSKLGISPKTLESEQLIGTLSGGEKVKIQIAKLLQKNPDILLLDEPTNDLDIETLEWLEELIVSQKIPVMFVSHDETLLEKTANMILHLEQVKSKHEARHTVKKTDYRTYVEEREQQLFKQSKDHGRERRDYKDDKRIISHQKSSVRAHQIKIKDSAVRRLLNKKMRNILVQEEKAESKLVTDKPEVEDPIFISFDKEASIPNGKKVLDLNIKELKIGERILAKNIELLVSGPSKVAIIGDNGIGKTTMLREIYKDLSGREDISVGYMPQNYNDILNPNMKAINYLTSDLESVDRDVISAYMGRIKLDWQEMNSKTSQLSYGQKAKLMILKMMVDRNNVLLLDEPTRNLSAISNPVIREMLKSFNGSIITISHDRKLLREVCDVVYKLEKDGLKKKIF